MESTIKEALYAASEILMNSFGKIKNIQLKQDQSNVVTQADLDSEKAIVDIIEKAYPDHNIIGEETGFRNKNSEYTWIVDPLDGTSNFASHIPWFGVLIGVLKGEEAIAGGMYLPCFDEYYFAEKGKGAFRNGIKIQVNQEQELKRTLFSYCLDYSEEPGKTDFETRVIGNLVRNIRNLRCTNCVVDFGYVADGRLGGCATQSTKIWDIVAPSIVITEAGGRVTDFNGKPHRFLVTEENYLDNYTIVSASPVLHAQVMDQIAKSR